MNFIFDLDSKKNVDLKIRTDTGMGASVIVGGRTYRVQSSDADLSERVQAVLKQFTGDPFKDPEKLQERLGEISGVKGVTFTLSPEISLLERAGKILQTLKSETVQRVDYSGITDQRTQVEIAKLCAQENVWATATNIGNFGITDQDALVQIAKLCAQQNGTTTAMYIRDFGITDQSALIDIAKLCAQQSSDGIACDIYNFGIKDPNALIDIAKLCAQQNGWSTVRDLSAFGIKDQTALVEIAKLCAQQNGSKTAEWIADFGIDDQEALVEIAKLCARQNADRTVLLLARFNINDSNIHDSILSLCVQQSPKVLIDAMRGVRNHDNRYKLLRVAAENDFSSLSSHALFDLGDDTFNEIARLASVLQREERAKNRRRHLFAALRQLANEVGASQTEAIMRVIESTESLAPRQQTQVGFWLVFSLLWMRELGAESINSVIPVWEQIGKIKAPRLRQLLTPILLSPKFKHEYLRQLTAGKGTRLALAAIPLTSLETEGVSRDKVEAVWTTIKDFGKDEKSKLKDVQVFKNVLEVLALLAKEDALSSGEKASVLSRLTEGPDEKSFYRDVMALRGIMQMGEVVQLKEEAPLADLHKDAVQKRLPLTGYQGKDLASDLERVYPSSRHAGALFTYAAGLKSYGPAAMDCLNDVATAALNGTLHELRYATENNPHLETVFNWKQGTKEKWTEPLQVSVADFTEKTSEKVQFSPQAWLKQKVVDDKHLGETVNHLTAFLSADTKDDRVGVKKELGQELRATKDLDKEHPDRVSLVLQSKCIRICSLDEPKHKGAFLKALSELEQIINTPGGGFEKCEFENDVKGLLKQLKAAEKPQTASLIAKITDDPMDILLCGTEVSDSCQRINGQPSLNRGLLGYMRDGKNQVAAVIDPATGKIVARCLLRLVWDGEQPVVFVDRIYPAEVRPEQRRALLALAEERANALGVPLVSVEPTGERYPKKLHAVGGPAPFRV